MSSVNFVSNLIGILGVNILCRIVPGNPKSKRFYHTTCDLSCASVTVHDRRNTQGRIYIILTDFTVFS